MKRTVRVADYIVSFLITHGVEDIFLVSGGGIMYLCDAVGRNKAFDYVSTRHEQGSAIAAEAYARMKGMGACLVTTGPGATNAITGVACAWYDSVPMMVISGQQKRELIADYGKYRNLGPQEANIIPMVTPITKYAKTIMKPERVRYELEKAWYMARTGRPGPVWIDVPLDVQSMEVRPGELIGYEMPKKSGNKTRLREQVRKVVNLLKQARRPILILGNGMRLSGADQLIETLLRTIQTPAVLPFGGLDLIPEQSPYLAGKFGPGGQRRGNFALQNADLVLAIGTSLNVASIGFNYQTVAPKAKKVLVNIDKNELSKPTLKVDLGIAADAKEFVEELIKQAKKSHWQFDPRWLKTIEMWKRQYPSVTPDFYQDKKHVNSYVFFDKLSDQMKPGDVLVTGIGLDAVGMYQAFRVKRGQRAFVNKNFGPMGWGLPAAIGACIARHKKPLILVTGDGGLLLNAQELGTVDAYRLPIKIFVFNNGGYESIRATQKRFFEGLLVGASDEGGVKNPDFKSLAVAYRMTYYKITNNEELKLISKVMDAPGPVLCEVNIAYEQERIPKAASFRRADGKLESKPLEDMAPFLPEEEVYRIMHIFEEKER